MADSVADTNRAWDATDAWTLAAVASGRRGSTLSQVIGAGDAINHDILTRDALRSSLGALSAAGLVEEVKGRLRLTSAGRQVRRHWRGGMFNWAETLIPELAKLSRSSNDYPLSEDTWQAAYDGYRTRMGVE